LELEFPLEDPGTGGGGLGLRYQAGVLQGDGEGGVGQRVIWGENGERHGGGDGLIEAAGVAQGADQAVVGLDAIRCGGDGGAEGAGRLGRQSGGELVGRLLAKGFGSGGVGWGHGCL
jgi:hypothetical protein